ncbi:Nucleotidyltransferase [Gammaproteobacteria bacterium]
MSDAQIQFQAFHNAILLDPESNDLLREKRDTLLRELKEKIDPKAPSYSEFHQGSYALSTGVKPISADPDMDIGIVFNCLPEDYHDPVKLKCYIKNALKRHNRSVRVRNPCVTVEYMKNGSPELHIDMAVYCTNSADVTQLARGRDTDPANIEYRYWEASEAKKLNDKIINAFSGTNRDQWRRVVRYLKRWRDIKIGHKNIPSIALTVEAMDRFHAVYNEVDGKPRDLIAMRDLLDRILGCWVTSRLQIWLPVQPYCDLLENVIDNQMVDFKKRLTKLHDTLNDADKEADTHEACKLLQAQFGDDFPVPPKSSTTKMTSGSIIPSGRSARD